MSYQGTLAELARPGAILFLECRVRDFLDVPCRASDSVNDNFYDANVQAHIEFGQPREALRPETLIQQAERRIEWPHLGIDPLVVAAQRMRNAIVSPRRWPQHFKR